MRPTLDTRKPIDSLTGADMAAFPIWEFAIDEEDIEGRDETWVRPVNARIIPKGLYSLSVAADFQTKTGISITGFVDVTTADGIELGHGVLLPDGKYVFIDVSRNSGKIDTAKALGLNERDVFPLTFTLRVRIAQEEAFRVGSFE